MFSLLGFLSLINPLQAEEWPDLSQEPANWSPHTVLEPQNESALIISVEEYSILPSMNGAKSNGRDWFQYFKRHRGIPVQQVKWLHGEEATSRNIKDALKALKNDQPGGGLCWLIFIGHGARADQAPRILPYDVQDNYYDIIRKGVSIADIVKDISDGNQQHFVGLFDGSFNGKVGNQPLFSEEVPQTKAKLLVSQGVTLYFATQPSESSFPLSGTSRPAFSYLALGGLRGWADANKDGQVQTKELSTYVQNALRTVQIGNEKQQPYSQETADITLAQSLETEGPNLERIRDQLDPVTEGRSVWRTDVRLGSAEPTDYLSRIQEVESKAREMDDQRRKEDARQTLLVEMAQKVQNDAREIWRQMAKARKIGGKEIFELIQIFVTDYSDVFVEVDGVSMRVDIPEVAVAKRWLREKGRKIRSIMGYEMVLVSAEPFYMGSTSTEKDRDSDETLHQENLRRDYFIGKYEVTQRLWQTVMQENPSHFQRCGLECPVENISWCDAIVFSNRLSKREGFDEVYTLPYGFNVGLSETECTTLSRDIVVDSEKNGYRLPTEAEWEYAARGGRDSLYSGSGEPYTVAWFAENSRYFTHAVGQREPNDWGIYDMSGNVWEYVWDWYATYPAFAEYNLPNYEGPNEGKLRVIRGGSWGLPPRSLRVANRHYIKPGFRIRDVGLRLVRTAE